MIAILLTTYNGGFFLREQLDSLCMQTNKNFSLYIRDDGSTDNTLEIIKEYTLKYSNIILVKDGIKHRGACFGFLWLLEQIEADYYMFCDQDDVWMPFKIQLSYEIMQAEESRFRNLPILIHTDLTITDSSLNILYPSLWEYQKTIPTQIGRKYLCLVNYVTGCTMFINRNARELAIVNYSSAIMHDHWLGICVDAAHGRIVSIPTTTIYYRQHGNNTIGASKKQYKFPKLQRYLHIPDYKYDCQLFQMIKVRYNLPFYKYLLKKIIFYIKL